MSDQMVNMSPKKTELDNFIRQKPKREPNPLYGVVTPIFNRERGYRMRVMRMALLMDQEQLADALGVSQRVISDLESGRQAVVRKPFTLAQMVEVFGNRTSHILLGTGAERFSYGYINDTYWDAKLKGRKRKRSGIWDKT
jgi:transcriptional regulator with XRE-family HTH domain